MLDLPHLNDSAIDYQMFVGDSPTAGQVWHTWRKPRGTTWTQIYGCAAGGNGGLGGVGVASTTVGGGGGGGGGQGVILIPSHHLPDNLFLSVSGNPTISTYVAIQPSIASVYDRLLIVGGGGSASAGGAGGAGGTAGSAPTIATCPLAGLGQWIFYVGQAGVAGGTNNNGASITLPVTGNMCSAGAGGGGLPAANTVGWAGGGIQPTGSLVFPVLAGGAGGAVTPTAGSNGTAGIRIHRNMLWRCGGSGGGSSGLSAAGGAAGGIGGAGHYGCGGGGGGAGFTGQTAAPGGQGGPGLVVIISW